MGCTEALFIYLDSAAQQGLGLRQPVRVLEQLSHIVEEDGGIGMVFA